MADIICGRVRCSHSLRHGGERTILDGWGNADTLLDIEWIQATGAADILHGNNASERLDGLGGDDDLRGHGGADTLNGGAGDDTPQGDSGADTMDGGTGADRLVSNGGIDVLIGGLGGDQFVFNPATDLAIVEDFSLAEDALVFEGGTAAESVSIVDANGNGFDDAEVTLSVGGTIILYDVDVAAIEAYLGL